MGKQGLSICVKWGSASQKVLRVSCHGATQSIPLAMFHVKHYGQTDAIPHRRSSQSTVSGRLRTPGVAQAVQPEKTDRIACAKRRDLRPCKYMFT